MTEFASENSYQLFAESVIKRARFVHEDAVAEFLSAVCETAKKRTKLLPIGEILFRAQKGLVRKPTIVSMPVGDGGTEYEEVEVEAEAPLSPERMVPSPELVGDGRINVRGIACLYLGTTASAVISEMRPWVGSYITIARFKLIRACRLVDCSLDTTPNWRRQFEELNLNLWDGTETTEKRAREEDTATNERGVWGEIGYAFSKPVTRDEPHLDYLPTQILAEAFRKEGYDGIMYKSLLDVSGKNIALFEPGAATLIPASCCLYRASAATFKCERVEEFHDGYRASPNCPDSIISSDFKERL